MQLWKVIARYFQSNKKTSSWKDVEYFDENWKARIMEMCRYISVTTRTIMDLGCGKMWLRDMLPSQIQYIGVDYRKRNEHTVVCDFNKKEFPSTFADVIFVSGCLEYIEDPEWFIQQIANNCTTCILSYCTLESFPDLKERKHYYWKNHLTKNELIDLFKKCSMQHSIFEQTGSNHNIFVFTALHETI